VFEEYKSQKLLDLYLFSFPLKEVATQVIFPTNAVCGEYNLFCDLNFPSLFPQKPRFWGSTVLLWKGKPKNRVFGDQQCCCEWGNPQPQVVGSSLFVEKERDSPYFDTLAYSWDITRVLYLNYYISIVCLLAFHTPFKMQMSMS